MLFGPKDTLRGVVIYFPVRGSIGRFIFTKISSAFS